MFNIREENICGASAVWHDPNPGPVEWARLQSAEPRSLSAKPRPFCCAICGTATTKYPTGSTLWPATYKEDTIPKNKTFLFTNNTTINQNYESLEAWPKWTKGWRSTRSPFSKEIKTLLEEQDWMTIRWSTWSAMRAPSPQSHSSMGEGLITWLGAPEKGE